ncbi:MAG: hypothetical protein ACOVLC_06900 [Flavobacterium sp.]
MSEKKWYSDLLFHNNKVKTNDGLTPLLDMFENETHFVKHFVENTIFFNKEHIEAQQVEIQNKLENNEKIHVRFSTKCQEHFYYKAENGRGFSVKKFKTRSEAQKFSIKNNLYFRDTHGKEILVLIDKDGNYEVRKQIEKYTKIIVSQGTKVSNYSNYTISHVWENTTTHPLYFTALWNIVLIPSYLAFILDKSDKHSEFSRKIKLIIRGLCLDFYSPEILSKEMKDKLKMALVFSEKIKQENFHIQFV